MKLILIIVVNHATILTSPNPEEVFLGAGQAIAMLGRLLMVVIYLWLDETFWRFAAFDGLFTLVLSYLFYRALIAELQTRP